MKVTFTPSVVLAIALLLATSMKSQSIDCQKVVPPPATTTALTGGLGAAVDAFKGAFGNRVPPVSAKADLRFTYAQNAVLSKFPNADKLALRMQGLAYVCQLLNADKQMSTQLKSTIIMDLIEGRSSSTPTPTSKQNSGSSRRKSAQEVPQPSQPTNQPSFSGNSLTTNAGCTQNVMGTAINATVNCGPQPYSVTPSQVAAVTDFLKKHGATAGHVELNYEDGAPGAQESVEALRLALSNAGLTVTVAHGHTFGSCSPPGTPGLIFDCFRANDALTDAVSGALLSSGVISTPPLAIPVPAWAERQVDGPVLIFRRP